MRPWLPATQQLQNWLSFPRDGTLGGRYHQTVPVREQSGSCWGSFHHTSGRARSLFSLVKHGNTLRDPPAPRWSRTATTMDDWRGPFLVLHHEPITHKVSSLGWVCSQFAPKQKGNSVKYKTAQRFNNHEWNSSLICPQGMSLILLILWGSQPCFLMCVVCRSEHPECLGGGQQGSAKQLWP